MTRAELLAAAEALEWAQEAFRGDSLEDGFDYLENRIAELRAQAAAMKEDEPVASTPHAEYDWMEEARALAAQCWCDPETAHIRFSPNARLLSRQGKCALSPAFTF